MTGIAPRLSSRRGVGKFHLNLNTSRCVPFLNEVDGLVVMGHGH